MKSSAAFINFEICFLDLYAARARMCVSVLRILVYLYTLLKKYLIYHDRINSNSINVGKSC
jgi:hypothetical protein